MDKEKELWLESINAKAFPEPVKYVYTFPGYHGWFNLSENYIKNTSLGELQETYRRNSDYVQLLFDRKNNRTITAKVLNIFKKPFGFKVFKRIREFRQRKT